MIERSAREGEIAGKGRVAMDLAEFLTDSKKPLYPSRMVRTATTQRRPSRSHKGHCVICGAEGKGVHDFVCGDCGDPLDTTLYCERCGRRLTLHPEAAVALLREYGLDPCDLRGLVFKVTACSRCMKDDETSDVALYRIRLR